MQLIAREWGENIMKIKLANCNNIDSGEIEIKEGRLNIKYAINGTGKSTIAHTIEGYKSNQLDKLRPFKYLNDNEESHNPSVSIDGNINNIKVFDENYINTYVFKKDELLENSFEIFVKTEKYDEHMREINKLVSIVGSTFKQDPEIDKLIDDFSIFISSFGNTQNGYSKAGELGKSLGKGNKLQNIPEVLKDYEPFLKSKDGSIQWIKWQSEGRKYIDIGKKCPYCVSHMTTPKETILKVSEEYDAKYLTMLSKILGVFESLKYYFDEATQETINSIVINTSGISEEQIGFLKSIKEEVVRLRDTLLNLKNLGFDTLRDVDKVIVELEKKKINLNFFPKLKSVYTESKIDTINNSLQKVIEQAGKLQGEIIKQKKEIAKTIEKYSTQINGFLSSAGYKYFVGIDLTDNKEKYKLVLKFNEGQDVISQAKNHLSYGERNALALVLFMYQAIKEEADFIVLDDPISSFDNNKKYAILNMLFRGKESFQEKTVLMLTHDFEPVLDAIYNMKHYFQPSPVASHIVNINGCIEEKQINKDDIKSYIEICNENIQQSTDILHKLIYLRRGLEITQSKGITWQMVSNVFHKNRDIPKYQSDTGEIDRDMTLEEYKEAEHEIRNVIPEFNYKEVYARVKNKSELIKIYNSCKSGYEKVQIYRLIFDGEMEKGSPLKKYVDETFHVQNDYLFQLNPREYKIVPQYILDFCDKEVAELNLEGKTA